METNINFELFRIQKKARIKNQQYFQISSYMNCNSTDEHIHQCNFRTER